MSGTHYPQLFCMTRYILGLNDYGHPLQQDNVPPAPDRAGIDPGRIKIIYGIF